MSGKSDCQKLMNAVMPLAKRMLTEYGEFYPYGGYMKPSGEIVHVGAKDEEDDHPKSKDLLYVLRNSFTEMAATGACKATAIVLEVHVVLPGSAEKSNAVQICLEHLDGYSAEVFVPYQTGQRGSVTYGTMFAQEGTHDFFGKDRA